jgi:pSer/pThr/pTyr-binding forkhead associated (FHA) protein
MDALQDIYFWVSKLTLLGLIYFVLLFVVIMVLQEMRQHVGKAGRAPGRLQVVKGGSDERLQPGRVLGLQSPAMIGAHGENEIVLNDKLVSRRHARLRRDGTQWLIEDLGSTNGTFVDGQRCTPHREHLVPAGATLEIGDVVLQLLE